MQALIVGCGYLGRRVATLWRSRGATVSALTRSDENAGVLRSLDIRPIQGDVLRPETLQALPAADIVLYAVGYDRRADGSKRDVCVQGLTNVLREIAPRTSHLIYVSSTSVYGQDAGEWVDEATECTPSTDSGRICLEAEEVVRSFFAIHAGRATVLRFSGIYGPGRLLRRIESVRAAEPIEGNPDGFLNLIHVDDGARVIDRIAEQGARQPIYAVTDNRPIRRQEYYTRLAGLVGASPPIFQNTDSLSAGLNKRCSNARLRDEFGEILQFPGIELGLPNAVTNESANRQSFAGG
jgi:nucleoside-diphosphate-sugar epimerase